ncbi:VanZ family protein [Geodermatophilus sp. DSM 44513]|uniref:VanZ family protein n=1 Tax=Geodermatophilus sp. DSM 44513 TaxID=1528104 RepID=UPI0037BEE514
MSAVKRPANLVLFIPFGFLVCASFPGSRQLRIVISCCAVSLVIEGAQLLLPGRHPSIVDVALNSAGVALGAFIFGMCVNTPSRQSR